MYFSISPSAPSTSYSTASPMDIPTTSSSRSASCAYPSWPRRSSLSSNSSDSSDYHNHSFVISDEELFGAVFEDSPASTPASDMSRSPVGSYHDRERTWGLEQYYLMESGSLMTREVARQEKERRESQQRRRSVSLAGKKRKGKKMSVIPE